MLAEDKENTVQETTTADSFKAQVNEPTQEKQVFQESNTNSVAAVQQNAEKTVTEESQKIEEQKTTDEPSQNVLVEKKAKKEPDFFNTSKKKVSLQDHFNRFRKAKKQDIKYRNYVSEQALKNRKDPEHKERLREKFIETAKKYFGVPYGAKYWKEGEKHYNAPLYLDCCALVRQVVYDLREDFGFQLDRWNQAYQFDTLPIDLKFEEMRPGDLVFYSGIYYNDKMRKQKHNMVHVEIFTGGESGEQSIGARWQKGVVQYFDSFKFTSTSYHSIEFHYKSLDTWLEGICKSHCDQHSWSSSNIMWAPGKKSIFSIEDEYDEADMDAPDLDDQEMIEENSESVGAGQVAKKKKQPALTHQCFVGNGNNDAMIRRVLVDNLGFKLMARGMMFSNDYRFKWTQTSMEINYMNFVEGKQICNHISNSNKVFTNKMATIEVLEDLQYKLKNGILTSDVIDGTHNFVPETYRLDMVAELHQFLNSTTDGLWMEKKSISNMGRGIKLISDVRTYRENLLIKKDYDAYGKNDTDIPTDSTEILLKKLDQMEKQGENKAEPQPEESSEPNQTEDKEQPKKIYNLNNLVKKLNGLIVQKYMESPSLINKKKYDLRYFMIIACTKPYLVLTHTGYARLSLEDYSTENYGKNDKFDKSTHLTNASVQKFHPKFKEQKEQTIYSMDMVRDYFLKESPDVVENADHFYSKVVRKCDEICRLLFESVKDKLERKYGCFEIFGLDFLLDDKLDPQLIEINTNPAMFTDTQIQKDMLPKLADDLIKLSLQLHPSPEEGQALKTNGTAEVQQFLQKEGLKSLSLDYNIIYTDCQQ